MGSQVIEISYAVKSCDLKYFAYSSTVGFVRGVRCGGQRRPCRQDFGVPLGWSPLFRH